AIDLPVAGGSSVETKTLKVMSMDDAFTRFARGWTFNSWGGTSSPQFAASQDTRPGYFYSGAGSQKFEIINKNGGEVQLVHAHNFVKGKTYRATLKIRSEESTSVKVFMRRDEHPWDAFASRTLTVGSAWQTVEIEGAYIGDVVGSLRVAINAPAGTVWVDEVTLAEVARNDMAPVSTEPIPDTLFGMHVNKLGVHNQWPGLGTRIVRLWNTGTDWSDLEPANNAWDFSRGSGLRLDMYVNYILSNEPEASILYTLGVTPQWASASPNSNGFRGPGSNSAPKEMADWRDYVRTLATRYAGKIRYWELWNEPDYAPHWVGGYANLVEMARIAREELLAADPNNKLVGPGFSAGQGMRGLEEFLVAGGGAYVDMIGFHWYYSTNPESLAPMIDNVRALMRAYGVDDKPLWNTEGAFICNSAAMDCKTFKPTLAQLQSVNARAMFIMAARGVANFNYHNWESAPWGFGHLVESDFITPTPAAGPFAEARTWARGAKIVDAFRINDLIYAFKLERNGEIAYVLWATRPDTAINVPSAWDVNRVRVVTGNEAALPTTRQLVLGIKPILLRP
ncbi:MAG TPA: glycosyl hydrolase, partial [Rhodothermales bacterium]|nr:glycosyl hydrolase [Rhodothermales bacterium]